jgi:hypothetical protein
MSCNLTLQTRSKSFLLYYKRDGKSKFRTEKRQRSIENLIKQPTYTGQVTNGSQKRLTRALENLLQVAEPKKFMHKGREYTFKVNFVTLTLYSFSRKVPGYEAHKNCMEPFLRWLRSKGMTCYVWKAELQSKRKDCHQLHYHLTTDVYIDKFELRDKWNELQKKAGYLDHYFTKFGHWNPNSTDVHATHNKRNLIGYLKKKIVRYSDKKKYQYLRNQSLFRAEMAKSVQNKETIEGKVWDCSQNIKVSYFEIQAYSDITSRLANAVSCQEMQKKEFERCTVYQLTKTTREINSYLPWIERQFYHQHIKQMREFKRTIADINVFSSS